MTGLYVGRGGTVRLEPYGPRVDNQCKLRSVDKKRCILTEKIITKQPRPRHQRQSLMLAPGSSLYRQTEDFLSLSTRFAVLDRVLYG